MTDDNIIDHGVEDKFCPECDDFHLGEVEENTDGGVVAWTCLKCGYTDDIGNVPHDAEQCDEWREEGVF